MVEFLFENTQTEPITEFNRAYFFLSNFYPVVIEYEGIYYSTSEHAYQASKTLDKKERDYIANLAHPGQAKKEGQRLTIRNDWDDIKIDVMREILEIKFSNSSLRDMLLSTDSRELIEGNHWADRFWGVCLKTNRGHNHLGKILMDIREKIRMENFLQ